MNPIFKIVTSFIILINRWIDSLSLQTVETIRRGFLFIMFIMFFVSIAIGYKMGIDSAKIKSPPIAELVSDSFKIKVSREKGGDFSEMLESEILKESGINSLRRYEFPVFADDIPDVQRGIIEPESMLPGIDIRPGTIRNEKPYEPENMDNLITETGKVKPLERRNMENESTIIINQPDKTEDLLKSNDKVKPLSQKSNLKPEVILEKPGIIER